MSKSKRTNELRFRAYRSIPAADGVFKGKEFLGRIMYLSKKDVPKYGQTTGAFFTTATEDDKSSGTFGQTLPIPIAANHMREISRRMRRNTRS